MEVKISKPRNFKPETKIKHALISRLIPNIEKKHYPRELKICKELFQEFENLEFWDNFLLDFPLNSLAFFKTEKGRELLMKEWSKHNFILPEKEKNEISNTNFFIRDNTNVQVQVKKGMDKSLKDSLKLW